MSTRWWLVLALACASSPAWAAQKPARVVVMATLHKMHAQVPAYGFDRLASLVEGLQPDVLCLEVQPHDLAERGQERVKEEYPRVIYPLLARHHYALYALEPGEPTFSDIVKPYVASARAFQTRQPKQSEAFAAYSEAALKSLATYWTSPRRVNDVTTDAVMAAKHKLQQAMIGAGERAGWQAWNQYFLQIIERAARQHPGARIVVLVGVEHTYWLRNHLRSLPGITLEDTASLMPGNSAE